MTLVDTDKNQLDRSSPQPNHTDKLNDGSIKAHATTSTHYDAGASGNSGYLQMRNKQILANDGSTNRAIFGFNKQTNTWGMFAVAPGADILTAPLSSYSLSSDKSFIVYLNSSYTFPAMSVSSGDIVWATSQVIPHGASYRPAALCFAPIQISNGSLPIVPPDFPTNLTTFIPNGAISFNTASSYTQVYYGVDGTNFYLGLNYTNDEAGTEVIPATTVEYLVYSSVA